MKRLITIEDMRAIDAAAVAAGVSIDDLMERAGRAVASAITQRWTPRLVQVLCGPGANGGDGWFAARALREAGWPVEVYSSANAGPACYGDALDLARFEPARGAIVIDALFGAGLSRPLAGDAERLAALCRSATVVAVDVPSGLPGDGAAPSGAAFRAALTVTFVAKKPAHILEPGRSLCGEVVVADIGADLRAAPLGLFENGPGLWSLPRLDRETHKYARGHVMVLGGPVSRTGAARLTARAALRVGAGLVTVLAPATALAEYASHATAVMTAVGETAEEITRAAAAAAALAAGPALGTDSSARERLEAVLRANRPIVLDADVFTHLAEGPNGLPAMLHPQCVLTPHIGEFRRSFPAETAARGSKIDKVVAAAQRAGAIVLLKGPDTVIAAPDGRAVVNGVGAPDLATAGSGDVLTGMIAGLLGQGLAPFEAACAGAWLHGRLGEVLGAGLIAEDLPEAIPWLLRRLAASQSAT